MPWTSEAGQGGWGGLDGRVYSEMDKFMWTEQAMPLLHPSSPDEINPSSVSHSVQSAPFTVSRSFVLF